ncbi:hypothetical protein ABK040_010820 [Willaertia magna]
MTNDMEDNTTNYNNSLSHHQRYLFASTLNISALMNPNSYEKMEKVNHVVKFTGEHKELVLQKLDNIIINKLSSDIYNNYKYFMEVSKEIETMEQEIVELSNLSNEWKRNVNNVTNTLHTGNNKRISLTLSSIESINNNELKDNLKELKKEVLKKMEENLLDYECAVEKRDFINSIIIYVYINKLVEELVKETDNLEFTDNDIKIIHKFNYFTQLFIDYLILKLKYCINNASVELKMLCILNSTEETMKIYLQIQSELIDDLISKIFIGEPLQLTMEMSKTLFESISVISDSVLEVFKNYLQKDENNKGLHTSGFIQWIMIQIFDKYCRKLRITISEYLSFKDLTCFLNILFEQSSKLEKKGIFIKTLLEEYFKKDFENSINNYFEKNQKDLYECTRSEDWELRRYTISYKDYLFTKSGLFLYETLNSFLESLKPIVSVNIQKVVDIKVTEFLESYLLQLFRIPKEPLTDEVFYSFITNFNSVRFEYMPMLFKQLINLFGTTNASLLSLMEDSKDLQQKLINRFCASRVNILADRIQLYKYLYRKEQNNLSDVSPVIVKFFHHIMRSIANLVNHGFEYFEQVAIKLVVELLKYIIKSLKTIKINETQVEAIKAGLIFISRIGNYLWSEEIKDLVRDIERDLKIELNITKESKYHKETKLILDFFKQLNYSSNP